MEGLRTVEVDPEVDTALQELAFASMKGQCVMKKETRFIIMGENGWCFSVDTIQLKEAEGSKEVTIFNAQMKSILIDLDMLRKFSFEENEVCLVCIRREGIRFRALPHPSWADD